MFVLAATSVAFGTTEFEVKQNCDCGCGQKDEDTSKNTETKPKKAGDDDSIVALAL